MRKCLSLISTVTLSALLPLSILAATSNAVTINQKKILANAPNLAPVALKYATRGYKWALKHHKIAKPGILTIINFKLSAAAKRMWVIDLKSSKVLMRIRTTQGKGSGLFYAKRFSNRANTDETSLGVFKIINTYYGEHGLSERVQGLEKGINNNAYKRAVVIHPAWYVSSAFVKKYHRTGRSLGCFAVNPAISKKFIRLTNGGSILFAYAAPEQRDPYING